MIWGVQPLEFLNLIQPRANHGATLEVGPDRRPLAADLFEIQLHLARKGDAPHRSASRRNAELRHDRFDDCTRRRIDRNHDRVLKRPALKKSEMPRTYGKEGMARSGEG
jgi:hypothetical protein